MTASSASDGAFRVPLIIRGEIIDDYTVELRDRKGRTFRTPNVAQYLERVVARDPGSLVDLYSISLEQIYDYLDELGRRLDLDRNEHWRQAFEVSCFASNLSRPVLEHAYRTLPAQLERRAVRELVESRIGSEYLEGWVPRQLLDGRTIRVRAMGARSLHIIAGNVPITATMTLVRSAVTRNDAIVKAPSNDPLTMAAIARTMIDMAPNHPLTRHLVVAYWKGGDASVEEKLYHPAHIEKLVAWGGLASIRHVSKYLQPGMDLITLDPKSSTTLIGREAFESDAVLRNVARRAAADLGGYDQEACVNARVIFLESGTDAAGLAQANQFGKYLYRELLELPTAISNGPNGFDPGLKSEIQSILPLEDFYRVFTDAQRIDRGAVIVSQISEPVDFANLLYGRVGNVVPLDRIEDALRWFSTATQTVGIYPDRLREKLRDSVALAGGQMIVPLGYAITSGPAAPQDGIEPERRMCRWVVDNECDPAIVRGPWVH